MAASPKVLRDERIILGEQQDGRCLTAAKISEVWNIEAFITSTVTLITSEFQQILVPGLQ